MLSGEFYPQLKKALDESKRKKRNFLSVVFFVILGTLFFSLLNFATPLQIHPTIQPKILGLATADNQNPTFPQNIKPSFLVNSNGLAITQDKIKTKLTRSGEIVDITPEIKTVSVQKGQFEITVAPTEQFKPGKYELTVDFNASPKNQTIQAVQTLTQDFYWGVLDINVRRSIEKPNTETEIGMAVLDDTGMTQCKAGVQLELISPDGQKKNFNTDDQSIITDSGCADKSVTNNPDYKVIYTTLGVGTYTMKVTATIDNGTRSSVDTFEVKDSVPFDIERTAFPTRIYPKSPYPVSLTITANENYKGTVIETTPNSFKNYDINNSGVESQKNDKNKQISWPVNWQKGQTYKLDYIFKAPDISPEFYLLGPLKIGDFSEARQWQIVSDAIYTCTTTTTGSWAWATAANWQAGTTCGPTNNEYPGQTGTNTYNVIINSSGVATTITVGASYTNIGTITIANTTVGAKALVLGANTITASGLVKITQTTTAITNQITVGTGRLNAGAGLTITAGATTTAVALVTASTGTIDITGNVTFAGTASAARLTTTGIAQINLNAGTIPSTATGTFTITAGTKLTTTGTAAINQASALYGLITVTSGALTMGAAITTTGVTITAGTFTLGGNLILNGNLITGNSTTYSGAFTTSITGAARTIGTTGATGVTLTFNALTLAASAAATANLSFTVTNALTFTSTTAAVQSLTLNANTVTATLNTITMNQPGGIFTSAFNVNAGTANCSGAISLAGTTSTATWVSTIVVTTGTLTTSANITFAAVTTPAAKVVTVGTGLITITTAQTLSSGTMTITGTGTIDFQAGLTLTTSATAATFTQFSGATVKMGGPFTSNTTAYVFTAGSKVEFDDAGSNSVTSNAAITFADVQIDSGSTVTLAVASFTVAGNWTNNYAASGISGLAGNFAITFSGVAKTIGGTSGTNFYGLVISTGATIQLNTNSTVGAGNFVIGGATGGTATSFTHNTGVILTITGAATVNQPTTAAVIYAWNINTGSAVVTGTVTIAGTTATASYINKIVLTTGTLEMNAATSLTIGAAIPANHIIDTSAGAATLKIAGTNTNAANATSVPGTTSTWVFDGTVAQSIPMVWGTAAAYANLQILNTNAAGAYPAAAITATNMTGNITIGDDIGTAAIMKNGSVNIADNGGSIFTVKNAATFQMDGTTQVFPTNFGTFTFGATSTTIYNQTSAQNIYNVATPGYGNLTFTPAGTPTYTGQTGTLYIQGNLTIGNAANAMIFTNSANDPTIDINGNVNITATATLVASDLNAMAVAGNWTTATTGILTSTGSTVNFNGAAAQSITTGGIDANHDFNNLTVTNASTAGVSFADSLTLAAGGRFTDSTPNSKLIFTDGATYNFPLITINGGVTGDVTMTKGAGATHWNFIVPGTPAVTYVTVDNSDATGSGAQIDATSNCHDGTGNTYWNFSSNTAPVNDSLTFTNPYSSNIAIADDTTVWQFQAKVTDANGSTDINYVEFGLANSADSVQPYDSLKFRWTEATDTFSETADTQTAATLTSTSADSNAVGNQWTLNFKIKINNSFLAKDTPYAAELYSLDDAAASATNNYANLYQVTALSLSLNVNNGSLSLGSLLPGSIVTGTTITTVTTNYPNGYTLGVSDGVTGTNSTLLHTDAATRIADYLGTIATPTTWSGTGLGICVYASTGKDTAKWGAGVSEVDPLNKYAGVPQTATTIHSKIGTPTSSDNSSIGYKLVVPNNQKTGNYSGNITYTATGVLM